MTERVDVTDELMASLDEAAAIVRGEVQPSRVWTPPADVDVKAIRGRRGLAATASAPTRCAIGSKGAGDRSRPRGRCCS